MKAIKGHLRDEESQSITNMMGLLISVSLFALSIITILKYI
jgi:hypothetical protein